ncbi:MAG: nuclear transport factor 2 family protein [Deltaproteobacteria bacterium]|jgi:murein L,D-transpeptidase YafK|nr:nuclear transport factor 2 family protein [Deltaproteobacteria bacterium]
MALALVCPPAASRAAETDPILPNAIVDPGGKAGLILVVDKARQLLMIYRHDEGGAVWLEKVLPCSTGMVPGDKLVRGDKKTPEGFYIFRQKLLPSELPDIYGILAYPMDYPNFWDRKTGRGGDGIWTHGVNKPLVDYDSNGCIELLNHDLAGLEDEIFLQDTPVLVYDELTFANSDLLREEARDIAAFVEAWRASWADEDLAAYRGFYDPSLFYNTDELSYQGWMDRKARVAAGYDKIEIGVSGLRVFRHRDTVVASFIQDYKGDSRFHTVGSKRLYLRGGIGGWRIVAEEYGPAPGPQPDKRLTASEKHAALTTPPLAVAEVSAPVAIASAGVALPTASVLLADNREPRAGGQSEAQAAADESLRAAIEQGTYEAPARTVLAARAGGTEPAGAAAPTEPSDAGSADIDSADIDSADIESAGIESADIESSDMAGDGGTTAPATGTAASEPSATVAAGATEGGAPVLVASAGAGSVEPAAPAGPATVVPAPPGGAPAGQTPPADESAGALVAGLRLPAEAAAPPTAGEAPGGPGPAAGRGSSGPDGFDLALDRPGEGGGAQASPSGSGGTTAAPRTAGPPPAGTPAPAGSETSGGGVPPSSPAPPAARAAAGPGASVPAGLTGEAAEELLAAWLASWAARDVDGYFALYDPDFVFKDMNLRLGAFKRYRGRRIEEAAGIEVAASDVRVEVSGGRAEVRFLQSYKSDRLSDSGEKTLVLAARDGGWRIVSESFQAR